MFKDSGLLGSFPESDSSSTVLASSGQLQVLPPAIPVAITSSGLGCSYRGAYNAFSTNGTHNQKHFSLSAHKMVLPGRTGPILFLLALMVLCLV